MADHAALSRLLGPDMTPEQFLTTIWDHSPWLRRGAPASNQAPFDGLLTLEDMDELLMRARLPGSQAELLLFENLKSVSTYATPHMAFAFGASIILNHTDKVWPPANALCALLGQGFRYSFANLYFTPNNSQTAPPHSDDRDVFILQLHGKKHWRVWPTTHEKAVRRPFSDEQAGKPPLVLEGDPPIDPSDLGPPCVDETLEPGAVLYIPRGALHVADTTDGGLTEGKNDCSLHLTIAVPTADLSLGGFVSNAAKSNCFGLRAFRQSLPLGALPSVSSALAGGMAALGMESQGEAATPAPAPSLSMRVASGGGRLRLNLSFGHAGANRAAAPAAQLPALAPAAGSAGAGAEARATASSQPVASMDTWRQHHRELWARLHRRVRWRECHEELCVRMENHRRVQREALANVERALAEGRRLGVDDVLTLRPSTRMVKIVPLQMIRPSGELGGRRVAQASPLPGGPGRHKYIHTPSELLVPLEAFAAMPLGCEFAVGELPARHSFLRACAGRSLLGLGVAALLPK